MRGHGKLLPLATMRWMAWLAMVALGSLLACSINPATGRRQLSFIGEGEEIAMGRDADREIVEQFGVYPDEAAQRYVSELGARLAAASERPELPWTFRVLDDPLVNAFALPGGHVYVTRGILEHLNSEAELAGVLGHEIGHVTARHSVNQMSKLMLAQGVLVTAAILAPDEARKYGALAELGTALLFLKFSRDDERQADALGVRYAGASGYDPHQMIGVFDTLARVSQAAGGRGLPGWASTHPAPENRAELIVGQIAEGGYDQESVRAGLVVRRDDYLMHLDAMVYGQDPNQGYFNGEVFYHPGLRFRWRLPAGWNAENTRQAVSAASEDQQAALQLSLADASSPAEAADAFRGRSGIVAQGSFQPSTALGGVGERFAIQDDQGNTTYEGVAVFAERGGQVLQLLGYVQSGQGRRYADAIFDSLDSFEELTDPAKLDVEPLRIETFKVARGDRFDRLPEIRSAPLPTEELGLLNRLDANDEVPAGTILKTVRGKLPGR